MPVRVGGTLVGTCAFAIRSAAYRDFVRPVLQLLKPAVPLSAALRRHSPPFMCAGIEPARPLTRLLCRHGPSPTNIKQSSHRRGDALQRATVPPSSRRHMNRGPGHHAQVDCPVYRKTWQSLLRHSEVPGFGRVFFATESAVTCPNSGSAMPASYRVPCVITYRARHTSRMFYKPCSASTHRAVFQFNFHSQPLLS